MCLPFICFLESIGDMAAFQVTSSSYVASGFVACPALARPALARRSMLLLSSSFAAPQPIARGWRPCSTPSCFSRRHAWSIVRAEAGTASPRDGQPDNDAGENSGRDDSDSGKYDIPQSNIDWNADWSKYRRDLAEGAAPSAPPGRAPPTPAEKAARKAAAQVSSIKNTLPTRQALFADWRFWIAILLALSLFTAAVGSSQSQQPVPLA